MDNSQTQQRNDQPQKEEEQMTFDKLAVMINHGFKEAHKDLIDVKRELEQRMDYRFDGIQNQLDNIYLNFTTRREHGLL